MTHTLKPSTRREKERGTLTADLAHAQNCINELQSELALLRTQKTEIGEVFVHSTTNSITILIQIVNQPVRI